MSTTTDIRAKTLGPAEGVRRNTEHELRVDRRLEVGEKARRTWSCVCGEFTLTDYDATAKAAYREHFAAVTS